MRGHLPKRLFVKSRTNEREAQVGRQCREGAQQILDALGDAHLADEDKIRRVGRGRDRLELFGKKSIVDNPRQRWRRGDGLAEALPRIIALERREVGHARQYALGGKENGAKKRCSVKM